MPPAGDVPAQHRRDLAPAVEPAQTDLAEEQDERGSRAGVSLISRLRAKREPPSGGDWLYEVKHDGHRLAVIADGNGGVRLLSRNGYERSRQFGPAFPDLARLGRRVVLDARSPSYG